MADIIDNLENDRDTLPVEEINRLFSYKFNLVTEKAVSLKKSYINKLHGNKTLKLGVSLSDNSLEVYEITATSLSKICKLSGHDKTVSEVVFSPDQEKILYSASEDGLIRMWDCRAGGSNVMEYKDKSDDSTVRPISCLDVSCTGRVLCCGTQLVQDDSFLVFFDQRKPEPLGGYWNSHTEDITQVKFHKSKPATLASGSEDGLINIFDIMEETEDEALLYSLNVGNSVEKLSWTNDGTVSCVTQSNEFQLWNTESGDQIKSYTREKIAHGIKRSKEDDVYSVDAYSTEDGATVLLAGSVAGNGHCLRSVAVGEKKLIPRTEFRENKQVVRCCWQPHVKNLFVTAGELGIISVWERSDDTEDTTQSNKITSKSIKHKNRNKPY